MFRSSVDDSMDMMYLMMSGWWDKYSFLDKDFSKRRSWPVMLYNLHSRGWSLNDMPLHSRRHWRQISIRERLSSPFRRICIRCCHTTSHHFHFSYSASHRWSNSLVSNHLLLVALICSMCLCSVILATNWFKSPFITCWTVSQRRYGASSSDSSRWSQDVSTFELIELAGLLEISLCSCFIIGKTTFELHLRIFSAAIVHTSARSAPESFIFVVYTRTTLYRISSNILDFLLLRTHFEFDLSVI